MAIAFARSKDGKATKSYDIFTSLKIACTDFDPKYIWVLYVADGIYQKVAVLVSVKARV